MENFTKKLKVFFGKVKAKAVEIFKIVKEWVIAHKVPSIIIASVLAVAIILAIVLPIALGNKCEKGEHKLEAGTAVAPTCTEDGYTPYTCAKKKCDYTEKKDIVPAAHTWDEGTVTTEPTCGADGVKTFACTVENCDGTKTEAIAATGEHTSVDVEAVAPTCGAAGTTAGKKCSVCDAVLEGIEAVEATGEHTSVDVEAVAPTCGAAGATAGKKCSVCEAVLEGIEAVPATGEHTWVDATCAAAKTCSVCQATEGEALAHTPVDVEAVAPTCGAAGATAGKKCSVCGAVVEGIEAVPATGEHAWVDATCEAAKTCSVCAATEGEALAHTYAATEEYVVVEGVAYTVEACACGATQNGAALENYVVVEDAATLVIESGKTYILGETAMGAFTLTGELTNVTFIGGKFVSIKVAADATVDGLAIKDAEFAAGEIAQMYYLDLSEGTKKNVVIDGCAFVGNELCISNAIEVKGAVENITVTNCEFKNLDWNTLPLFIGDVANAGNVVITNNTADNFAQRFVRLSNVAAGTFTITDNTLTNWMYIPDAECNNDGEEDTNDAEIFKASGCAAEVVITFANNTLDGEALGAVEADGANLVVKADKTNEEETPDYVAPTPDAGEND